MRTAFIHHELFSISPEPSTSASRLLNPKPRCCSQPSPSRQHSHNQQHQTPPTTQIRQNDNHSRNFAPCYLHFMSTRIPLVGPELPSRSQRRRRGRRTIPHRVLSAMVSTMCSRLMPSNRVQARSPRVRQRSLSRPRRRSLQAWASKWTASWNPARFRNGTRERFGSCYETGPPARHDQ